MFNKLLVDVDEQREHLEMLEKAIRLSGTEGQLELFCCAYQPFIKGAGVFNAEAEKRSRHAYMVQCEGRLDHLAERIRIDPQRIGTDIAWDDDGAHALLRKCERFGADLVIYPVAPQSALLHHLLAPEDWKVLRECPVPLLISRDRSWPSHPRIAVAIDPFHSRNEPASLDTKLMQMAEALSLELEAELHVLHTYTMLPESAVFDEHQVTDFGYLQKKVVDEHQQRMEGLLAPWRHLEGAPEVHLMEGELHHLVPQFCKDQQVDLLIMGSVPRGALERLLLGSSAERILDRVSCDLMVIKPD
ncbi:universal stress protein [Marinobacterium mangrovicola]|uniref:Nucleotide-binding universal stress UspA family protein n=1 Tax=Marinobacterium mangrovicola TaxID=1476959 RepID=A0A4V2PEK7_9GAMM|nr:universal stress protein [Marinobacterium mangrovicola]TCK09506.1 nucleotide-binding universal stress UspA family protein [Marinobacterium mangrovicola]